MSAMLLFGAVLGVLTPFALYKLFRLIGVVVAEGETVLVTSHGRLARRFDEAGYHLYTSRILPWVQLHKVSRRRDFRDFHAVHVNDACGTTLRLDLWLEVKVVDPERALFAVADWDAALRTLVSHATTSILGNHDFETILRNRTELGEAVRKDITPETTRWGLEIDHLLIQHVGVLPEISQQLFAAVAARLDRARADIEEHGRLAVATLEAETDLRVASLEARAKAQYPEAIGKALAEAAGEPSVLHAYEELHALAEVRPHRTMRFRGFRDGEVRAIDALMTALPADPAKGG